MQRRYLLKTFLAALTAGLPKAKTWALDGKTARDDFAGKVFDYARLKGHARALAAQPYRDSSIALPQVVKDLDWDDYQAIRFRDDHALWRDSRSRFRAKFFHLGLYFQHPVQIYEVVAGKTRQIAYDARMFD